MNCRARAVAIWCALGAAALAGACTRQAEREVIVYTALDQVFAAQILAEFERASGIRVRTVYDTEATKSAGLAERLRRERARPQCDVFWNNEILRTILLAREGSFESYVSPAAAAIPAQFKDAAGLWTGFAARARVLAFDPARVHPEDVPRTHAALAGDRWRGRLVMGNPQFGTTGSHLALLLAHWGEERWRSFIDSLRRQDVRIVGGNAMSRDCVVAGEALLGLTDTDDVEVARRRGESIEAGLFEDDGVVLIPNTVALVKGAPHGAEARSLIDWLLSEEVEARLASSPSRQIPLRAAVPVPAGGLRLESLSLFPVSYEAGADVLTRAIGAARELLE